MAVFALFDMKEAHISLFHPHIDKTIVDRYGFSRHEIAGLHIAFGQADAAVTAFLRPKANVFAACKYGIARAVIQMHARENCDMAKKLRRNGERKR